MIEIDKPKIEIVDVSTVGSRSTGRFVVEPLERGFGTTLGNGMRRVLLSSLPALLHGFYLAWLGFLGTTWRLLCFFVC